MKKITQREARRLKAEVAQLKDWKRLLVGYYQPGVELCTSKWEANGTTPVILRTAKRLNHFILARADDNGLVTFTAMGV